MFTLDKNTVVQFEKDWVEKIKVFFYEAGCSGTKVDIVTDFEVTDDLTLALSWEERGQYGFDIYVEKKDKEKFESSRVTRVVTADHTGEEKVRYVFSSEQVLDRCGCGTSFGFEKPVPKIDLEKLKSLRERFRKTSPNPSKGGGE
jgi:Fe-S cluster assembly iron-binding protein IscA